MNPTINVIIVDDELLFRQGLTRLFKNTPINVCDNAENGLELQQILRTKHPDIVLLDLEISMLNGSDTLDLIKKMYPDLKLIILSRYNDENLIKDLFNRGACACLSKKNDFNLILEAVKRVFEYGVFKDNIPFLLKNPVLRNGHYYKLIYTSAEMRLIPHLLNSKRLYSEIAEELFVSIKTVENQAISIFQKTKVHNRSEFIEMGLKSGLNFISNPLNSEP